MNTIPKWFYKPWKKHSQELVFMPNKSICHTSTTGIPFTKSCSPNFHFKLNYLSFSLLKTTYMKSTRFFPWCKLISIAIIKKPSPPQDQWEINSNTPNTTKRTPLRIKTEGEKRQEDNCLSASTCTPSKHCNKSRMLTPAVRGREDVQMPWMLTRWKPKWPGTSRRTHRQKEPQNVGVFPRAFLASSLDVRFWVLPPRLGQSLGILDAQGN